MKASQVEMHQLRENLGVMTMKKWLHVSHNFRTVASSPETVLCLFEVADGEDDLPFYSQRSLQPADKVIIVLLKSNIDKYTYDFYINMIIPMVFQCKIHSLCFRIIQMTMNITRFSCYTHTHTHTHTHTYIYIYIYIYKLAIRTWGRPESSLSNSYYTEV